MKHIYKIDDSVIQWLLEGDVSIQYFTHRDLLGSVRHDLQLRIEQEGWGETFLSCQNSNGHWGNRFYHPKWVSTHYTLLDLKNLAISPKQVQIRKAINKTLDELKGEDGGINISTINRPSDVCVNGMFLNYACYFKISSPKLQSIIDFIITQKMPDGGFNCMKNSPTIKIKPHHSSLHSTLSVLEGIQEYKANGYQYRLAELANIAEQSHEFILKHHLYKSDHTGKTISKAFLTLSYPSRWKYNILRALDYFQSANVPWDYRMQDALDVVRAKSTNQGKWKLQSAIPGQIHFKMEQGGKPSRWNTLMALRVLKAYAHP